MDLRLAPRPKRTAFSLAEKILIFFRLKETNGPPSCHEAETEVLLLTCDRNFKNRNVCFERIGQLIKPKF